MMDLYKKKVFFRNFFRYFKSNKIIRRYLGKKILSNMQKKNPKGNLQDSAAVTPYVNKSGVVLSFDDSFRVKHWSDYGKDMFGFYDVKVTFNINAFHHFEQERHHTQEEIDLLLELQSNGHEIVHHGYKHRNALLYSSTEGIARWVQDDIIPLFTWMEQQSHSITGERFKKPVSYAYPSSAKNEMTTSAIVPEYFKIARGHLSGDNLVSINVSGFAPSICIDRNYIFDIKNIKKAMRTAKEAGKVLILMCHSILPDDISWNDFGWGKESKASGEYRISPSIIQDIIIEAKKNDMEFYTLAEVSGVATFIDSKFEDYIRENICTPNGWILIKSLTQVKEMDLSNRGICNLDGIQYFLGLEKIDLRGNNIKDFRLLDKLPNLKKIIK